MEILRFFPQLNLEHKTLGKEIKGFKMVIQKFVTQSYKIAKDKGFYPDNSPVEKHITGILSELFEVYEAHRAGSFTDKAIYTSKWFNNPNSLSDKWCHLYLKKVKDTFEDEATDLFIRIFNLSSYLKIKLKDVTPYIENLQNLSIDKQIININKLILKYDELGPMLWFSLILNTLSGFCYLHGINITLHIPVKIEFNKTREYLHGNIY